MNNFIRRARWEYKLLWIGYPLMFVIGVLVWILAPEPYNIIASVGIALLFLIFSSMALIGRGGKK